MKRVWSFLLVAAMLFSLSITACAAAEDTGFSDVAADAWYADAVEYVRDNGLMSGTSAVTFSPNGTTSRGQIAAILYRASGSPAVSGGAAFPDVADGAYYADASRWAAANGIITGYSDGSFGPSDPITRQQLAAILWRYAGRPSAGAGQDYADESAIAGYAAAAVDWARASGVIGGKDGNRFDPNGSATRAQVAVILNRYMELLAQGGTTPDPAPDGARVLVAYFSASGNTETVAGYIAGALDADILALIPEEPYTDADLDWTASGSRVNREHEDEALQNVTLAADTVPNWDDYDTVFIGYPIWWGSAAWPVNGFVLANDFTGKTVIPFCTSSSSGLGQSGALLEELAGSGTWVEGRRFSPQASRSDVETWVDGLDIQ